MMHDTARKHVVPCSDLLHGFEQWEAREEGTEPRIWDNVIYASILWGQNNYVWL
jgi:hypothetical protein